MKSWNLPFDLIGYDISFIERESMERIVYILNVYYLFNIEISKFVIKFRK